MIDLQLNPSPLSKSDNYFYVFAETTENKRRNCTFYEYIILDGKFLARMQLIKRKANLYAFHNATSFA